MRASSLRSKPAALSASTSESGMPSTHSRVSTSRAVRVPVRRRNAEVGVLGDVLRHFRERRCLQAQIHLEGHRACQHVDDLDGLQALGARIEALDGAGGEIEGGKITAKASVDAGAQHLHRRLALTVGVADHRLVHLRHRRGGYRFGQFREEMVKRPAQRPLDLGDRHCLGRRAACDPAIPPDRAPPRSRPRRAGWRGTGRA